MYLFSLVKKLPTGKNQLVLFLRHQAVPALMNQCGKHGRVRYHDRCYYLAVYDLLLTREPRDRLLNRFAMQ